MTQIHDRPDLDVSQRESAWPDDGGMPPRRPNGPSTAATIALLVGVAIVMAIVGYTLAGGRLISRSASVAEVPVTAVATAPPQPTAQPEPTAPPQPTAVAAVPTAIPAPTLAPTAAPTLAPTAPPQPTPLPQPTSPPPTVAPPKPTAPPPTAVQPPAPEPAAPIAAAPPAPAAPVASGGAMVPVRPGTDARKALIEGKIRDYFSALNAGEFGRAQQVCCTAEWRARYPLERWRHNFDGVTDLRLVGAPRYVEVRDDRVVVETDYTFVSGGVRRNFTLPWTFRLVGGEWQGDMAEAYPTP